MTDDEGGPLMGHTTVDEEATYRAFAAALGVEVDTPPQPPSRRVLVPVAEVERLRAMAAHKPASDDDLYDRYARLAGVRR